MATIDERRIPIGRSRMASGYGICRSRVRQNYRVVFFFHYFPISNLEGDLSAGAFRSSSDPDAGYRLLWVLLWSTLMGFGLQRLAIKLGTATGRDLATVCRMEFPYWMSILIWIFTELCLVGADIQAVIGSAIGLKLILGIPITFGILVTLFDTFIVLLIDCCGTRKLEACFAFLVSLMAGCFFANMLTSKPNPSAVLDGLMKISIPEGSLPFTIALIGSVIMPHNFFLQSAVVQSRSIDRSNKAQVNRVANVYIMETFCLLFVSLLINIAVVVAFANPRVTNPDGHVSPTVLIRLMNCYFSHLTSTTLIQHWRVQLEW